MLDNRLIIARVLVASRVLLLLVASLAATAAVAANVPFKGRTLEVADGQDKPPITRMVSASYGVPGSADVLVGRAQTCAGGVEGLTVASADPASGLLVANVSTEYRAGFSGHAIRSRLAFAAVDGGFRITESEIEAAASGGGDGVAFSPLVHGEGNWEKGLEALIEVENKLVDCLYR